MCCIDDGVDGLLHDVSHSVHEEVLVRWSCGGKRADGEERVIRKR